jgi:hypothetical protein
MLRDPFFSFFGRESADRAMLRISGLPTARPKTSPSWKKRLRLPIAPSIANPQIPCNLSVEHGMKFA